jgi:uncharacterized membrane protein
MTNVGGGYLNRKVGGILFIAAGVAFFVAALMAGQRAFYGIGFPFIGLGVALLIGAGKGVAQRLMSLQRHAPDRPGAVPLMHLAPRRG